MQPNVIGTPAPVGALANPIPMTSLGVTQTFTPEETRDRLDVLAQAFPPELVEWRVTNTTRNRRGNRGQVVAYADPRDYTDRLNAIWRPGTGRSVHALRLGQSSLSRAELRAPTERR